MQTTEDATGVTLGWGREQWERLAEGQTFDANGNMLGRIVQTPFFYDPDGHNVEAVNHGRHRP